MFPCCHVLQLSEVCWDHAHSAVRLSLEGRGEEEKEKGREGDIQEGVERGSGGGERQLFILIFPNSLEVEQDFKLRLTGRGQGLLSLSPSPLLPSYLLLFLTPRFLVPSSIVRSLGGPLSRLFPLPTGSPTPRGLSSLPPSLPPFLLPSFIPPPLQSSCLDVKPITAPGRSLSLPIPSYPLPHTPSLRLPRRYLNSASSTGAVSAPEEAGPLPVHRHVRRYVSCFLFF